MPTRRRERNQQLFREVNQRIREVGGGFDLSDRDDLALICECADADCNELFSLSASEYERVPRSGGYFLVKPGHEASHQWIVRRTSQYVVVDDPTLDGDGVSSHHSEETMEVVDVDA